MILFHFIKEMKATKKVKFWGDCPEKKKPPAKKVAYFKKNAPPFQMTVLSLRSV